MEQNSSKASTMKKLKELSENPQNKGKDISVIGCKI